MAVLVAVGRSLRQLARDASPAQRLAYAVGTVLIGVGFLHLLGYVVLGGPWVGPVAWRKPFAFGVSFGLTTVTLAWLSGYQRLGRRLQWCLLAPLAAANSSGRLGERAASAGCRVALQFRYDLRHGVVHSQWGGHRRDRGGHPGVDHPLVQADRRAGGHDGGDARRPGLPGRRADRWRADDLPRHQRCRGGAAHHVGRGRNHEGAARGRHAQHPGPALPCPGWRGCWDSPPSASHGGGGLSWSPAVATPGWSRSA